MGMIGMGMYEILLILGILGGGVGGLPAQPLDAPRDTVWHGVDYVLPGAHVAIHGNLEHAWNQMEGLLDEVSALRIVKGSPSALQGLAMARSSIAQAAVMGQAEVGLDFRKDLGSITVSLRSDGPEQFQVLVRARGRFDNDRLKESIAKELSDTEEYKGVTIYRLPDRDFPAHVLCFPDETTALLGPVEHVRTFLDGGALDGEDKGRELLRAALVRRGARALLSGTAQTGHPGAFLYLAPPAWMIDELFKEDALRHAAAALQGVRAMTHVAVLGRGTLTFDATNVKTAAIAAHLCHAASRLTAATEPLVDALFHVAAAIGPLLPAEELVAEVVAALTDEEGLREAADWLRLRLLAGAGAVITEPGIHRVSLDVDSPMGLSSLLMPLTGSLGWLFIAKKEVGAENEAAAWAENKEDTTGLEDVDKEGPMAMPPEPGGGAADDFRGPSPGKVKLPPDATEPNRRDLDPGG